MKHHRATADDQQPTQHALARLRERTEPLPATGRDLPRREPERGCNVAASGKAFCRRRQSEQRRRGDRLDTGDEEATALTQ